MDKKCKNCKCSNEKARLIKIFDWVIQPKVFKGAAPLHSVGLYTACECEECGDIFPVTD